MINEHIIKKLEENAPVFKNLLENNTEEQVHWKPSPEKWSLLELINHLYDEEREDFRQRIKNVLEDPLKEWYSVDPLKWVTEREYDKRDMKTSLNNFLAERIKSVEWLKSLASSSWKSAYKHPKLGEISAEKLLANWLAHDYLHIRQVTFLQYSYLSHKVPSISLDYAGNW